LFWDDVELAKSETYGLLVCFLASIMDYSASGDDCLTWVIVAKHFVKLVTRSLELKPISLMIPTRWGAF